MNDKNTWQLKEEWAIRIMECEGLSLAAKMYALGLKSYAWGEDEITCFPGSESVKKRTGVSVRRQRDHRRRLVECGALKAEGRSTGNGWGSYKYTMVLDWDGTGPTDSGRDTMSLGGDTMSLVGRDTMSGSGDTMSLGGDTMSYESTNYTTQEDTKDESTKESAKAANAAEPVPGSDSKTHSKGDDLLAFSCQRENEHVAPLEGLTYFSFEEMVTGPEAGREDVPLKNTDTSFEETQTAPDDSLKDAADAASLEAPTPDAVKPLPQGTIDKIKTGIPVMAPDEGWDADRCEEMLKLALDETYEPEVRNAGVRISKAAKQTGYKEMAWS